LEIIATAAASISRGRKVKTLNAWTAIACGVLPAGYLALLSSPTPTRWVLGLIAGLIYANWFEYAYHRYLLHWPGTFFAKEHLRHHMTVGDPSEAEHLNLGGSPFWVFVMFAVNGLPLTLIDYLLGLHLMPGMFLGFGVYFITTEEVHWRIHLGEWLPVFLLPARAYHLAHHDRANQRFNIFLPLWDVIFRKAG
jgi:hypothetical protein